MHYLMMQSYEENERNASKNATTLRRGVITKLISSVDWIKKVLYPDIQCICYGMQAHE